MPAVSKAQHRLMTMAYNCKLNKSKYCPPKIQKIADDMSVDDLKDFIETDINNLPERIKESIVYKIVNGNNTLLNMFKDWMTNKNIQFIENNENKEIEVLNIYDLNKNDQHKFLTYVQKIGLKKIWENAGTIADGQGSNMATLSNTIGLKFINPPTKDNIGSGDKFDNDISISTQNKKKPIKSFIEFTKKKKK